MTDKPRMLTEVLPVECRLCGWQFATVNGLWEHIPSHALDQAMYGTLATVDRLTADLAAERARSEKLRVAGDEVALQLSNWVEDHPENTWCHSEAALSAWRALAADDARRDGTEGDGR